jgi:diguanylate cyclase (GGDEF)-like protein/PAS domain S-box-containing protein
VIDTVSRIVDKRKLAALGALGRQVSDLLHQRSTSAELAVKEFRLTENVQEAKHTNTLHRFAARRFETLFHGVPIACFTFDEEIVIREWNREAERVFGLAACDAIDENMLTALSVGTRAAGALSAVQHILGGETVEAIEWPYRRTDGCIRRLLTSAFPLRGAQGQIVGGVSATIDITDRKQQERAIRKANSELETANARLARLASHDGLTGIPNYRAFHERLEDEFATSERHGEPLTLLLLDVDRFKSLNDAYGHPVGDRILQELAATLVDTARKGDFVARYGGEEFAVLMPRTSIERAKQLAERIRKAVRNRRWSHGAITISIGCASVDFDVATPADLVKRADRALYRSKNNGRDQVSLYADVA